MAQIATDNITPKQERTIVALLSEQTVTRAAEKAQVGHRTIYRWLDEPVFSRAYRKARREAFNQAIALTQRYAAVAVLKFGRDGIELDDLAARVDALEEATKYSGRFNQR